MSHRLQVLIADELDTRIRKAAERKRVSKGEWVRRAIETELRRSSPAQNQADPVDRLASLGAPTADIRKMLSEIEEGRR